MRNKTHELGHTPGPWRWESNEHEPEFGHLWSATSAKTILSEQYQGNGAHGLQIAPADARLIAAAPELLEALRAIMGRTAGLLDALDTQELWRKLGPEYRQAERAIARAEGKV
jgi:hypothetical protein